jgi:hypothetical protein
MKKSILETVKYYLFMESRQQAMTKRNFWFIEAMMYLRRSLEQRLDEGIASPFEDVLEDLFRYATSNIVVIGALALGFYIQKPRATDDVDVIAYSDAEVEKLKTQLASVFKKHRAHAFEHKKTGVELEVLTPEFIGRGELLHAALHDPEIFHIRNGRFPVKVAKPEYIIALKLRRALQPTSKGMQDQADIVKLWQTTRADVSHILQYLNAEERALLEKLKPIAESVVVELE